MTKKKRRLYFIVFMLASLAAAAALSLYALRDNVSFFYSPSEVERFRLENSARVSPGHVFRLGGLVKEGSIVKAGMTTSFTVTDLSKETPVLYTGILPDLFREAQGVVAKGSLDEKGTFHAAELLAKHDENYMPPEVAKSLKKAKE